MIEKGLHFDISFDEYRDIDALNASSAVWALESTKHLKGSLDGRFSIEAKNADIGNIVHSIVEGKPIEYVRMPNYSKSRDNVDSKNNRSFSWATKWAKEQKANFEKANADKKILSHDADDSVKGCHDALWKHELAKSIIDRSQHEVTVIGEMFGVRCKARVDLLDLDNNEFSDVKTCENANEQAFGSHSVGLKYPFRMAFYWRLLKSLGHHCDRANLIAVEKKGVHDVCVYFIAESVLEQFGNDIGLACQRYKNLKENKPVRGRYDEPIPLAIPDWAMPKEGAF